MNKKSLVIILKNPGTSCNIGCVYCAEARKKFISVEKRITIKQIEKLSDLTKDYSLNVLFHGGEPTLLSTEYYESIMNTFSKVNDDVFFGIQTNATNLDDKWIDFFVKNKKKLGISVSLDGTKEINIYRKDKFGEDTFDQVYKNIKILERNSLKTGMICTVVHSSVGRENQLYELLKSFNNLQFVKLNPCMDRNKDGSIPSWAVTPEEYFLFVSNFFDLIIKEGNWSQFYIEPIMSILKNLQDVNSSFCNYSFNKCFNFISVYPDGEITSCDNYNLQHGYLGNLDNVNNLSEILQMQNNDDLKNSYSILMKECSFCEYKNLCKGGCLAIRERYNDSNRYCNSIKKMIGHIKEVYNKLK